MAEVTESFPEGLRQPDRRSCGAACLVVAEGLGHPGYAARVSDPATFRAEVLAMHRRVTSPVDLAGSLQLPWPRALGTPPWAVARQLTASTGVEHHTEVLRWRDPASAYRSLVMAQSPPILFIGNSWLPRHVILVAATDERGTWCYEPSRGELLRRSRGQFTSHCLDLAGWNRPWMVVLAS